MSSAPTPREQSAAHTFSVQLTNSPDDLVTLNQWMKAIATQANFSDELSFKLDLILEEAITNVIEHGFADGKTGLIEISMCLDNNQVQLEVKDNGSPFNPLEDHEIVLPKSLKDATIGGLGIHLIKSYTDNISYQRKDDKNVLKMILLTPAQQS